MPKSKTKLKVVKLDDKRPLGDDEQINLVRDKVLDLFDEIHEKVTIPNTIIAMQVLVTDLAPIFPLKGITLPVGLVFSTSFISGLNPTSSPKKNSSSSWNPPMCKNICGTVL